MVIVLCQIFRGWALLAANLHSFFGLFHEMYFQLIKKKICHFYRYLRLTRALPHILTIALTNLNLRATYFPKIFRQCVL